MDTNDETTQAEEGAEKFEEPQNPDRGLTDDDAAEGGESAATPDSGAGGDEPTTSQEQSDAAETETGDKANVTE